MTEFLFLSRNPARCAQLIKNGELSREIKAYKDILCAAYWSVKPKRAKRLGLPKLVCKTDSKRQIVHWVIQSLKHFEFVLKVAIAACELFTLSGAGVWHPSEFVLLNIEENMPPTQFFHHNYWEDPPQQIPLQFHTTDAVEGNRRWYKSKRARKRGSTGPIFKRRKLSMDDTTFQQQSNPRSLRVS
jgi:hypothetical protein